MKKLSMLSVVAIAIIFSVGISKVYAVSGQWSSNGNKIFYNDGDVGIGADYLNGKLGIRQGQGVPWITLRQPNYDSEYYLHNSGSGARLEFATKDGTNGQIHWQVFQIQRNGDIFMGYNNDPVDVYLNGSLRTKQIIVTNNGWADYVFEPDYKLKTISELESYVKENKHLPNVPSAKEVEQNGLSVADMQTKQMEKIEELTLYVIDLQKQVEELRAKVK